jgi:hypothetical protein
LKVHGCKLRVFEVYGDISKWVEVYGGFVKFSLFGNRNMG